MIIFHLHYGLLVAGIETMLVNIANEQVNQGHTVKLLILNNAIDPLLANQIDKRIEIVNFGKKKGTKNPIPVIKLNLYLLTHKFDILHAHNPRFSNMILVPIPQNKKCSTLHCLCKGKLDSDYLKNFNHNFAISEAVRKDILEKHQLESITVYNGIHPEKFKHDGVKLNSDGFFHIVQVGRLNYPVKGQDILIEAVGTLFQGGLTNIKIDFIGDDQNNCEMYLRNLIQKYGLQENVSFLGVKSQQYIAEHLCEYDLYAQPSRMEGFGLTVAEAMAAKVATFVSSVPGPMDIINNGEYGYFFNTEKVESCAEVLKKIISDGVDANMVEQAYNRVYKLFDVKNTASEYLLHYEKIIKY